MSFIHMVSFKFGTDASENDKQNFIDSLDSLKTIPGV
jgi:hypothetical protein